MKLKKEDIGKTITNSSITIMENKTIEKLIDETTAVAMELINNTDIEDLFELSEATATYDVNDKYAIFMNFEPYEYPDYGLWFTFSKEDNEDCVNVEEQDTSDLTEESIRYSLRMLLTSLAIKEVLQFETAIMPTETASKWKWIESQNRDGHLLTMTGDKFCEYYSSPQNTGIICYKLSPLHNWDKFYGPLSKFKEYAETEIKNIFKIKMLQPIPENAFLPNEPEWTDVELNEISWYVPTLFSVDDTFEGINVNTDENNDWINLYALYNVKTDGVELMLIYDGEDVCWDAPVEMDPQTKEMVERVIREKARTFMGEEN